MTVKSRLVLARSLLYFIEVVRNGQISRTAELNGIKQANLSRIIRNLEKEIGVDLLMRNARGVCPTVAGEQIYNLATEMEKQLKKFYSLNQLRQDIDNVLTLYVSPELSLRIPQNFSVSGSGYIIKTVKKADEAEVAILKNRPEAAIGKVVRLHLGDIISTDVWIVYNDDDPAAERFYNFLVASTK